MDLQNLNKDHRDRRKSMDLTTMVYGKIPPQARDFESAVLGAIMLEKSAYDEVCDLLKPKCFYSEAHQRIYRAMQNLQQKNQPIDILTVVEELNSRGELETVGGPYYVERLTSSVVSSANISDHARIIHQKFMLREQIRIGGELVGSAYEDGADPFELLEGIEKDLTELTTSNKKTFVASDEVLIDSISRLEKLRLEPKHITGIPSGFAGIDRITHGWQNSDLIILAARPAVGKTALALQIAREAATNKVKSVPVAFFSLEMSRQQLQDRNISAESEVFLDNIRNGSVTDEQMQYIYARAIDKLLKARIFYDDRAALTIQEIRSAARKLVRLWIKMYGSPDGLIIVDYLQLMSGTNERRGNREQEISTISRGLKQIAKELNLPVIALSQLSRAVESRSEKMPQLSDLRESGAIEQDADMVMFLYRPEYYDNNANEFGESTKGETHVKIAKHRNGSLETIKLRARLEIQKFYDWDGLEEVKIDLKKSSWKPAYSIDNEKEDPF